MIRVATILILMFLNLSAIAQEPTLQNIYLRPHTSLNGFWKYIVDPYENGYYNYRLEPFDRQKEPSVNAFFRNAKPQSPSDLIEYDFDKMDSIRVPGDWNSQKQELLFYEGTLWYKTSFDHSMSQASNRLFLYFEASNYKTEVYLNGNKLGTHIGGFTPFNFEITDGIREKENFLIVKVDNKRLKEGVPTVNTDWWNYGGLTRDVKLIEVPQTFIEDYTLQLDQSNAKQIKGYIQLNGPENASKEVSLQIDELGISSTYKTDSAGKATFEIESDQITYWSVTNPKRYTVQILAGEDAITDLIGFRSIQTEGSKILLNGEAVFLRGISIHEESPLRDGRAHSREDAAQLLEWARELGCNFVRLAHYPHNEHMVRLADEMGIMVWEENPVYWTIQWENEDTYSNAENQLSELIRRDKNRASVIIWSMANETPNIPARNVFLRKLSAFARAHDPTRLISAALEQKSTPDDPMIKTISDPFAEVVDILSFNQYIGWYEGLPEKIDKVSWEINQEKPVFISEFGAGAKQGLHGAAQARWTEEFQEDLYVRTLNMIDKMDKVQGLSPWILVDFRSPRRMLAEIQDGWNRKGLISDEGKKKKAFYVLQQYYRSDRARPR